ncbi:pyridoxamine 5'-phosphate oxidase family protein [Nonomuraea basaltis]|uniref:pyridoxamine 5'-phosphate oxidase family protein n=1 Tax=Nonomuraea basaltis TaxID=2495887 RepID=UPI001486682A|nr:pyridoxamine 5'-phosphate oxidase family protein [Nonomuraea basaltis]
MSEAALAFPAPLVPVIDGYRTCEFVTIGRSGVPIAWPTIPLRRDDGTILITTSIALPQKAYNIRRDPRVALLFSDPTGSGQHSAPQVLVQGTATCPDQVVTAVDGLERFWALVYERQPASQQYSANALTRHLLDFYYMRLLITVTPTAVLTRPPLDAPVPFAEPAPGGPNRDAYDETTAHLPSYHSAVLVVVDDRGFPRPLRVRLRADPRSKVFVVDTPDAAELRPGPASILCHRHDEKLWELRSFVTAGRISRGDQGWVFAPTRFIPGALGNAPAAVIRTVRSWRRTAAGYLAARGLPRPRIPWEDHAAIKREVTRHAPLPQVDGVQEGRQVARTAASKRRTTG